MKVAHRLMGYDKRTEQIARQHDVPADLLGEVIGLAQVPVEDPEAIGCYPLTADAIRQLSLKLPHAVNADMFDWFLEPFAVG